MIKLKGIVAAVATVSALGSSAVFAQDVEKVIEARQSFMQLYSFNLGLVGEMAKGNTEYDPEIAASAAQNLLALAKMNNSQMWPEGSSKADAGLDEMTRALPEMWSTFPKVLEKQDALTSALENFATVAGKDLDSLRGGMKAVGDGCKGCHTDFRAKKEEG
ncbi:c-type cytochrome [Marinobacterium rhizophilum]|uniref:Cytochrome c n=1 Tax=Marinobacterium rhizophilum TaxID=420402 RepID=A0ABY5HHX1_9GAMM|nr:cytochrome c [Marinobacterium rhizophilum]UTW11890.1 cytochrome c [Marinobacterium rhizophilum]